jgi:hypothetical protein
MYPGSKCKVSLDIQDLQVKLFLYLQDLVFILTTSDNIAKEYVDSPTLEISILKNISKAMQMPKAMEAAKHKIDMIQDAIFQLQEFHDCFH